MWAALLHAGDGAAPGAEAALWLAGVRDQPPAVVQVCVPHRRRVRRAEGIVVLRRRDLDRRIHPAARPTRLRVEEAVLDVADAACTPGPVVDVVLATVQRRVSTPERLAEALAIRPGAAGARCWWTCWPTPEPGCTRRWSTAT
jgi:hypothetical protein